MEDFLPRSPSSAWVYELLLEQEQPPSDHKKCLSILSICLLFVDADVEFSWTEEEVVDMYDNCRFIIAADGKLLS